MKALKSPPSRLCWIALLVALVVVTTAAIVVFVDDLKSSGDDDDGDDDVAPTYNGTRVTDSLKHIFVISRHGNRGGLEDYPLDPYPLNDTQYWPYGTNELTPHGRTQMYNLGLKLRSLYNGFLGVPYINKEFYAGSTGVERVAMSGQLVLAGLFRPFGIQVWNQNLLWQPVPIYSNSTDKSAVVGTCPRYKEEKAKAYEQFLVTDAANISALTGYVSNVTGETATVSTLYFMFDKLISEDLEGYAIPEWAQQIYPEPLKDFYGSEYVTYFAGTDEIVRLVIGTFFGEMLSALQTFVDGEVVKPSKMHYYSGHDTSIVALQAALGIERKSIISVVHPGSAMMIELHQDSTNSSLFYVEVLYIDGSSSNLEPEPVSLPACGQPCYFDTLVNISQKFIVTDYEEECQTSSNITAPL